jgi:hypothetical protein
MRCYAVDPRIEAPNTHLWKLLLMIVGVDFFILLVSIAMLPATLPKRHSIQLEPADSLSSQLFSACDLPVTRDPYTVLFLQFRHLLSRVLMFIACIALIVLLPLNLSGGVGLVDGWQASLFNVHIRNESNFVAHTVTLVLCWIVLLFSVMWFVSTAKRWLRDGELISAGTRCKYSETASASHLFSVELFIFFLLEAAVAVLAIVLLYAGWERAMHDEAGLGYLTAFTSVFAASLFISALGALVLPLVVLWRLEVYFGQSGCSQGTLLAVYTFGLSGMLLHTLVIPAVVLWKLAAHGATVSTLTQVAETSASGRGGILALASQATSQLIDASHPLADAHESGLVLFAQIMLGSGWVLMAAILIHFALLGVAFRLAVVSLNSNLQRSTAVRDGYYALMGAHMIVVVCTTLGMCILLPALGVVGVVCFIIEAYVDSAYFAHAAGSTPGSARTAAHTIISFSTVCICIFSIAPAYFMWAMIPGIGGVLPIHFGGFGALVFLVISLLFVLTSADRFLIIKSPHPSVTAAFVDPPQCIAEGDGIVQAYEGKQAEFVVRTIDSKGVPVLYGGERVSFTLVQDGGQAVITGDVLDCDDGTYQCRYVAGPSGTYVLEVLVNQGQICRSPFRVKVIGLEIDPPSCTADGPGLVEADRSTDASFVVTCRTINRELAALTNWRQTLRARFVQDGRPVQATIRYAESSHAKYTVTYNIDRTGDMQLEVTVKGVHIAGSPFSVTIWGPHAPSCEAVGEALHYALARRLEEFSVNVFTASRRPIGLPLKGRELTVALGQAGRAIPAPVKVVEVCPGQYCVSYRAERPGEYDLAVLLGKEHIAGSPFALLVDTGDAFGPKCKAKGPGLKAAQQLEAASFVVETFDENAFACPQGGARVDVVATCAADEVHGFVSDNGDGTYSCTYTPNAAGEYKLSVVVNTKHVPGSPFRVKVTHADIDPPSCVASGEALHQAIAKREESFMVETFAKNGMAVPLPNNGRELVVRFTKDGNPVPVLGLKVVEVAKAQYKVAYKLQAPGDYSLHVLLHEQHIYESPFDLLVDVADPHGPKCRAHGSGLKEALQDQPALFSIETFDMYGNKVTRGGAQVHVVAVGQHEEVTGYIEDNQDGTYSCVWHPSGMGMYKVTVMVGAEHVQGSPFSAKVKSMRAHGPCCTAAGEGLSKACADVSAHFVLSCRTQDKELVDLSDDLSELSIDLAPNSEGTCVRSISHAGLGQYNIEYVATRAGKLRISVLVEGNGIQSQPFTVDVQPSAAEKLFLLTPLLGIEIGVEHDQGKGVRVFDVRPGGPAAAAGIVAQDHIYSIGGQYMQDRFDFEKHVENTTPGDTLDIAVLKPNSSQIEPRVLVVGARGMSPQQVEQLRNAADVTSKIWNRAEFGDAHPWIKRQKIIPQQQSRRVHAELPDSMNLKDA